MSIERSAGILLPISSLPSKYGIGTLGKKAYEFVDFLIDSKQTYWQVLPVGHTSYGDSPYQCFSSFAGNPYFIDLDILCEDGLLSTKDLENIVVENETEVDYGYLYSYRYKLLYKAYINGKDKYSKEFKVFCDDNSFWLDDYALFMSLKKNFNDLSWQEWPDENIKLRKKDALNKYKKLLKDDISFYEFIQFLFFKQFSTLKNYANINGIKIIGDLPIYVALDSAEVWADPNEFQLDEETLVPRNVAGVPPDYFSEEGQLWGNPLYDWDYMKKHNYEWWILRLKGVSKYFDVIRIDHFIGFERYWSVPFKENTAKNGCYYKGPSIEFIDIVKDRLKDVDFIAEDLGVLNDDCINLLKHSGFPGMRVLEFSMSDDGTSYHSPHNHVNNCVCYISTHDNEPINGWFKNTNDNDRRYSTNYYGLSEKEGYNWGFIRGGMNSVANLFICQIQDYLGLGCEATINRPGTLGNWKWRLKENELTDELKNRIAYITHACNRDRKDG